MNNSFHTWIKQSLAVHFKSICDANQIKFRVEDDEQNTTNWQQWVELRIPEINTRENQENKYTINVDIDLLVTCMPGNIIFNLEAILGILQNNCEVIPVSKDGTHWFCLTLDRELEHSQRTLYYGRLQGVKPKRASLLAFYENEVEVS